MMRWLMAAAVLVIAVPAWAQEPSSAGKDLNQEWIMLNGQMGHMQKALSAFVAEGNTAQARAREAEERLNWVLNNWVSKPAADGKR